SLLPEVVYTPLGFDDNDNSQFVYEGYYPSSCYRKSLVSHKVDLAAKKIVVKNTAVYYGDIVCTPMLTRYSHEVNLGVLPEGRYDVFFEAPDENNANREVKMGQLLVVKAHSAEPDDYLYAPVDRVWLTFGGGHTNLKIVGGYSNTCLTMDRIEFRREGNVVVVLPIAKLEGEHCSIPFLPIPYEEEVDLGNIGQGRVLFHVRSLSGQAVNSISDLPEAN
ncbi:MAG: hypothetical protein KDD25_10165, partial [Bdellovibrionales bacterium]|nr:hypothetical protein [Bdellovibrionales bacterium]